MWAYTLLESGIVSSGIGTVVLPLTGHLPGAKVSPPGNEVRDRPPRAIEFQPCEVSEVDVLFNRVAVGADGIVVGAADRGVLAGNHAAAGVRIIVLIASPRIIVADFRCSRVR